VEYVSFARVFARQLRSLRAPCNEFIAEIGQEASEFQGQRDLNDLSISGVNDLHDSLLKALFHVFVYALGPNSECETSCL